MEPIRPCLHFDIHKASLSQHYDIQDSERNIKAYTVEMSRFSPGKPDLFLIPGSSRDRSSMVACARFKKLSRTMKIGLGNTELTPSRVQWEGMKSESAMKTHYVWSVTLSDGSRRTFAWKKSSTHSADGGQNGLFGTNYKLVDMIGGGSNVVAVCTTSSRLGGHSKLQLNFDLGPDFQKMVLMTFVALYEALRRRTIAAAARAASGGIGG